MAYPTTTSGDWPGTPGSDTNYVALFKQAYADTIRLKAQTMESRLSDTCTYEELRGDPLNLDAYKPVATTTRTRGQQFGVATNATTGGQDSTPADFDSQPTAQTGNKPYSETLTERRTVLPEYHEFAELFDPRDEPALMRAIRPDSNYLMNVAAAFSRKKDSIIVSAFDGNAKIQGSDRSFAYDVDAAHGGDGSGTATGLPAGTIGKAAEDDSFGTAGLYASDILLADTSAAKKIAVTDLVAAREVLEQNGAINPGDPVYIAIHPAIARNLLADTNLTSYDFNAIRPLVSGEITNFLGCEFRMTNQISSGTVNVGYTDGTPDEVATATGYYTYVYTRSSMVFGMAQDMSVRFDELPQRGYALQAFHSLGLGAVRMDPKKMVRIGSKA